MKSTRACRSCTTNPHLKDWIGSNGNAAEACTFGCVGDEASVDLVPFAQHVDKIIRQNFSPNTGDEVGVDDEDPEKVIASVAGIAAPLARRVVAIGRRGDGDPSFYDFRVSDVAPWPMEHGRAWSEVVEIVKSRARYFSKVRSVPPPDLLSDRPQALALPGRKADRSLHIVRWRGRRSDRPGSVLAACKSGRVGKPGDKT
jgi:hypothetical protein